MPHNIPYLLLLTRQTHAVTLQLCQIYLKGRRSLYTLLLDTVEEKAAKRPPQRSPLATTLFMRPHAASMLCRAPLADAACTQLLTWHKAAQPCSNTILSGTATTRQSQCPPSVAAAFAAASAAGPLTRAQHHCPSSKAVSVRLTWGVRAQQLAGEAPCSLWGTATKGRRWQCRR